MSEDTEDQKWLDAMGGKVGDPGAPLEREATVIRNAMLRELQGRPTYEPSQARLDMLMAEASRQGLLRKEKASSGALTFINRIYEFLAMPAGVMASLALVLGLSITAGWQSHVMNTSEESAATQAALVTRGGASAERKSQIVADPLEAAQSWQKDLLASGIEHAVSFEAPQRVLIRIRLTPEAIQLLERRRFQAPAGDWITVVLEPATEMK
jgi:hypothetical protein